MTRYERAADRAGRAAEHAHVAREWAVHAALSGDAADYYSSAVRVCERDAWASAAAGSAMLASRERSA